MTLVQISMIVFVMTVLLTAVHFMFRAPDNDRLFGRARRCKWLDPLRMLILPCVSVFPRRDAGFAGWLRHLLTAACAVLFAVSFVTAYYQRFLEGRQITGYFQMIHIGSSAALMGCLIAAVFLSVRRFVFAPAENPFLRRKLSDTGRRVMPSRLMLKCMFWAILGLTLPLTASILLSMLPLFGTEVQEMLILIHRVSAMLFTVAVILFAYTLFCKWLDEVISPG